VEKRGEQKYSIDFNRVLKDAAGEILKPRKICANSIMAT